MSKRKKGSKESRKGRCPQCGSEVNPEDECCDCGKLLLLDEKYDAYADKMNCEI